MVALLFTLALLQQEIPKPPVDSLRAAADSMKARADSLYGVWDVQWKKSDSLRIASMLIRMESNKLKRELAAARKKADKLESEYAQKLEEWQLQQAFVGPPEPPESTERIASMAPPPPPPAVTDEADESSERNELGEPDESDALIVDMLAREASIRTSVRKAEDRKLKRGQTESDSATMWVMESVPDTGRASYYGAKFHGRKTSSGEVYNMNDLTCAHRWLPYGTKVQVTNLDNGKVVTVRVNDRGPFHHGRLIDLSKAAAREIDMIRAGTANVELRVIPEEP